MSARRVLILGGTAWFGRELAEVLLGAGDEVHVLARGVAGEPASGAIWHRRDRTEPDAYAPIAGLRFDDVVEISWQPGLVRAALAALADRAAHWTLLSSGSVYADDSTLDTDESAATHAALDTDEADGAVYGPAKVACELAVAAALPGRSTAVRAGLIAGPGDPSDRTGYWPGRLVRTDGEPVLVPAASDQRVQLIDVRDLAEFVRAVGVQGRSGPVNAVGLQVSFADVLAAARWPAGPPEVLVEPEWLVAHEVAHWSGPRSLPLWLPAGAWLQHPPGRALAGLGLRRRPLAQTLRDLAVDERERGLDRPRRSGLSREEERELLAARAAG